MPVLFSRLICPFHLKGFLEMFESYQTTQGQAVRLAEGNNLSLPQEFGDLSSKTKNTLIK